MKHFEDTLYAEYFQLTKQYLNEYGPKTIVLYQNGSFLEMYAYFDKKTDTYYGSIMGEICQFTDLRSSHKYTYEMDNQEYHIYMAGFTLEYAFDKYINKIQENGYSAVIYLQKEMKPQTTRYLHGVVSPGTFLTNDIYKSNNNEIDENIDIINKNLSNNVSCLWITKIDKSFLHKLPQIYFGIANINIFTGETLLFQHNEIITNSIKDITIYDEISTFFEINVPNEIILIYNNISNDEIDLIINYIELNKTLLHKVNLKDVSNVNTKKAINCEKQIYQYEVLKKFYPTTTTTQQHNLELNNDFILSFNENEFSTQAFIYLLEFVYKHNPNLVEKIHKPLFQNKTSRLILANHSLKQLNIINDDSYYTTGGGKYSCILNMLNLCLTSMGKRRFSFDLLNPIYPQTKDEFKSLQSEYDIIDYLLKSSHTFLPSFKQHLQSINDLSKIERQIIDKKISPQIIAHFFYDINKIIDLYNLCNTDNVLIIYLVNKLGISFEDIHKHISELSSFIQTHIYVEIAKTINTKISFYKNDFDTNFLCPGVDTDLDSNLNPYIDCENKLKAIQKYFCSLLKEDKNTTSTVKIHKTEKDFVYSLLATNRRCELIESLLPVTPTTISLVYDYDDFNNTPKTFDFQIGKKIFQYTKSGNAAGSSANYKISNSQIQHICNEKTIAKFKLCDSIQKAYIKFLDLFSNYRTQIQTLIEFVTLIDLLYCKTYMAQKYNYSKPQIAYNNTKSFVDAVGLRHCLIEQIQQNEIYVANDIELGKDNSTTGVLLYGTNMVGKTSFIKSIGIAVIMAQAGLFVPAQSFIYYPYKYIFTRILGNDNLFKGQSTFATEMIELRTILRLSNSNSLIIGDELCSGTETASAVGIFMSGIKKLYEIKCSFIFATHLHEIVEFDDFEMMPLLKMCHMKVHYDREKDRLVYERKMCDGPGETMYGLEVCNYLKLSNDFMNDAYEYRKRFISMTKAKTDVSEILTLKKSKYNGKKLKGQKCEICNKNVSTEIHHKIPQKNADKNGVVLSEDNTPIHKNKLANLVALCEECHLKEHH